MDVGWLRSPQGHDATNRAAALLASGTELAALTALGRDYGPVRARAAVALIEAREALASKFADPSTLIADKTAAEQTSDEAVARHLAARFAGLSYVADLGSGMGGDTLAIAAQAARVLAVDRDLARAAMTQANAEAAGLGDRVEVQTADLSDFALPEGLDAVWLDPARRDENQRQLAPEAWSPTLARALELASQVPGAGIKLAPGIELEALPSEAEVEFVSQGHDLKTAVAWLGTLRRQARTATVLHEGETSTLTGDPVRGVVPLRDPGAYLYDLEPSVGRAGLVDQLAQQLEAWKIDEEIAFLSSNAAIETPFARRFRVRDWAPFAERRILDFLTRSGYGRVDVMRRGSPVDTNALEIRINRALHSNAPKPPAVVVLTRVRDQHVGLVCEREA